MMYTSLRWSAFCVVFLVLVWASESTGQETRGPVKITIKDGKAVIGEPTLPIDPTPRITAGYSAPNSFGLTVEGKRITCSTAGSVWSSLKIDGQITDPFTENLGRREKPPAPLLPGASGKRRFGTQATWRHGDIHVTQVLEFVPSKPSVKPKSAAQKRLLDTCRVTNMIENKGQQTHKVAFKTSIDILIVNNDGALYASPTTAPGRILNGVILKDKDLPDYLWVLERPNLDNPGYIATLTFKHSKGENPFKVVLANLSVVANFMNWDVPPQPAGDSACALFWEEKELKPGQKRELVWGYGGGISTTPDTEGQLKIGLSGSFEPGKLFTISALVDDPLPEQALALELPAGLELVEGRTIQPVPLPSDSGSSLVMWRARVVRTGEYEIRIRSSTGTIQSKYVTIEPVGTN